MPDHESFADDIRELHRAPANGARGMGRGLAAILSVSAPGDDAGGESGELRHIRTELIVANPRQPRRSFDETSLVALADSMRDRGVLQPVLVRPVAGGTYELVAGERRWRAAKLAELPEVPALVRPREDAQALEVAIIENMAREDLNPVDEARACAALVEELGLTREEVGRRVGRSRVAVSNLLRLLDLPEEVLGQLEAGELTEGHGRALLLAADHGVRRSLGRTAADEGWSVRALEAKARDGARPGAPRAVRRRRGQHPDQLAAAAVMAEALSAALGREVSVRPSGDAYRAELSLASTADAEGLARRLGLRAVG